MLNTVAAVGDYARIFTAERWNTYPMVDRFEHRMGYALDRQRLEEAARTLACPLKAHPPNWQHGRVLYALASQYLWTHTGPFVLLDIGTAKGFSALCLQWALGEMNGEVFSVDVINPLARVRRNSVIEHDGLKTLPEFLSAWPEAASIRFEQCTGIGWLKSHVERVHIAFVDGKHRVEVVREEGELLAARQWSGDLVMFDDVQIPGVFDAVTSLESAYDFEHMQVSPERAYAIGTRR